MKACIIENNVVTNVIEVADEATANQLGATDLGPYPVIGDEVVNNSIPEMDARIQANTEGQVRATRNNLLIETDWWAVSDRTMTADETAYRQALRDLPEQEGFPNNVTYPTKP